MCFTSGPSSAPPPVQQVAAPPPPPQKDPVAPVVDPTQRNRRDTASTQRQGTAIFRNDLMIPTGGNTGSGLNIPR